MNIKITPEFLVSLEAKAKAATPGPWYSVNVGLDFSAVATDAQDDNKSIAIEPIEEKDADFIAAANPAVILALIARIRELESK